MCRWCWKIENQENSAKTKIKFVKWVPLMEREVNLIMREHPAACQVCVFYLVFDLYSSACVFVQYVCVSVFFSPSGGPLCGLLSLSAHLCI